MCFFGVDEPQVGVLKVFSVGLIDLLIDWLKKHPTTINRLAYYRYPITGLWSAWYKNPGETNRRERLGKMTSPKTINSLKPLHVPVDKTQNNSKVKKRFDTVRL